MSEFNSSDEEVDPAQSEQPPFRIDWLDLSMVGYPTLNLGISSLPGCKFKETWRNLDKDLDEVQAQGVQDVLVLCTPGELVHCRVPDLLEAYARRGLLVHHEPVLDGAVPDMARCCALLDTMHGSLGAGRRVLVHGCLLPAAHLRVAQPRGRDSGAVRVAREGSHTDRAAVQLPARFPRAPGGSRHSEDGAGRVEGRVPLGRPPCLTGGRSPSKREPGWLDRRRRRNQRSCHGGVTVGTLDCSPEVAGSISSAARRLKYPSPPPTPTPSTASAYPAV
ncbi:cyclin-dependent kinase inhibitor 3 isoform X2 [Petromyzon marinus]|uniref:protein-tyrosine-phosphatase n=1 Tax=Petromyzon marinus TaxID=7757 RepID=A0AAJ7X215_PETMA|nr:cyclin-dependent kinase inhibitor 3 isoform X1 [Petromyzon marinus]